MSMNGSGPRPATARIGQPMCGSCVFAAKASERELECRRHPPGMAAVAIPVIVKGKLGSTEQAHQIKKITGFPVVPSNAWCGEFRARVRWAEVGESEPIHEGLSD